MARQGSGYKIHLKEMTKEIEGNFEEAMKKAVYRVHRELTQILSGSRSGNKYPKPGTRSGELVGTSRGEGRKPKNTSYYTASAPGEAPAVRLGDLRTSYRPVVEGSGFRAKGKVGTPLKYGPMLEHGTSRMAPRPHLKPAFERSKHEWLQFFNDLS